MESVGLRVRAPGQACWVDPVKLQRTRKSIQLHKMLPISSCFAPRRLYSHRTYLILVRNYRLRYRFVNSDFGLSLCVTGHRHEVTVQLRNKERSLRAEATRDLPQRRVVVRIVLFEDLHKLITRKINTLQLCVVCDVVDHADAGYAGGYLTGLRIHYDQFG